MSFFKHKTLNYAFTLADDSNLADYVAKLDLEVVDNLVPGDFEVYDKATWDAENAAALDAARVAVAETAALKQSSADKLRVSSDLSDDELAAMGLPTSTATYAPPSGFPAGTLAQRQSIADKFAENKKFSLTDNELAALGLPSSDEN